MSKPLISIVVPVYNESGNIAPFYTELTKHLSKLKKYSFEIIFVNDGSQDNSLEELHKLAQKDTSVQVIDFVRNFGKEIATTAGLHHATGDAAIMIDADMQHPIELIPTFIQKWEQGSEVVVGVRNPSPNESMFKKFRSALFYKLLNRVADTKITPSGTDFQLLDRAVVNEFNRFTERGRITRGLISWLGFPTDYVYFDVNQRIHGAPTYSTFKLIRLATNSFVSLSLFPLKLAGYLGIWISIISGAAGLYMFTDRFILNDPFNFNFTGPALLAVLILFLVGILLSCLGLIALYIGNIHGEVANRPLYVTRNRASASSKSSSSKVSK